jgi:uncharacterized protein (TIGR02246 family)
MKPAAYTFALVSLLGVTPPGWCGPTEEIAEIGRQRAAAFDKGDVDAYTAAFADNAVVTPFWAPFRVEGIAAIKDHFATLFQTYPTRQGVARQATTRLYANDTVAVTNSYGIANWTDQSGNTNVYYIRGTATWVKMGADWKIVESDASRLPIPWP